MDFLQSPLFLAGGLLLTWLTIGLTVVRFIWERGKVEREEVESAAKVEQIRARKVADQNEANEADATSAASLLEVVNYMIGLIDRLDQRIQKEIGQSIEDLKRLVSDRITTLEGRIELLSFRLDEIEKRMRKKDEDA